MPEFFVANKSAPVLFSMPPGGVSTRRTMSGVPRSAPSHQSLLLEMPPGAAIVFILFAAAFREPGIVAPSWVFEVVAAIGKEFAGAGDERRAGLGERGR